MLEFPHDAHTHTNYSDGIGAIWENVASGESRGLSIIGITDHSHYLSSGRFRSYLTDIRRWRKESDVLLLAGIEGNATSTGVDVPEFMARELDYVIGSVHQWVETPSEYLGLVRALLLDDSVDIIGHFGASFPYIGFPQWMELVEIIKIAEENGKAFEISSRYRVPELEFVKECVKRGVKLVFSSDAHSPSEVGNVGWSERIFKKAGGKREDLLFGELL